MNRPKTHAPPILNDARVSHHRGEHLAAMRNHLGACRTYFHARVAGPESAAARREAQRIPGVFASLATTQMRFPAATSQGRERFGSRSWQMSTLLGLTIARLLSRPRASNQTQIAPRRVRASKSDRLPAPSVNWNAPGGVINARLLRRIFHENADLCHDAAAHTQAPADSRHARRAGRIVC